MELMYVASSDKAVYAAQSSHAKTDLRRVALEIRSTRPPADRGMTWQEEVLVDALQKPETAWLNWMSGFGFAFTWRFLLKSFGADRLCSGQQNLMRRIAQKKCVHQREQPTGGVLVDQHFR